MLLVGCVPAPTPPVPPTLTPVVPTPVTPVPSRTPEPAITTLRIWLPPQFAPTADLPGGEVLDAQLAQFRRSAGYRTEVRLKQASGPGGLLASLTAAYNVAPSLLPHLIALSRDDLTVAAEAGLVIPLDNLISTEVWDDYYPFARDLVTLHGKPMGLPFATEARVLVYNTRVITATPQLWSDLITGTLILPGAENSGLTTLYEYLALGGVVTDEAGAVTLDVEKLTETLNLFLTLKNEGRLPLSTLNYADVATTWQVFRERRADFAVTSVSWFLAERDRIETAAVGRVPVLAGEPFVLADGWSWAVVNTDLSQQAAALTLLRWLTAPEQLSAWARAAQVLPPRARALTAWSDDPALPALEDIAWQARVMPPTKTMTRLGPLLKQAIDDVLNNRVQPFAAANRVIETLAQP